MTDRIGTGCAVYRHGVPVDGRWHTVGLTGPVVHVGCRQPELVELWALAGAAPMRPRTFRVFGTGHPLPDDVAFVGTAIVPGGELVWHLFESGAEEAA